MSNFLGIDTSNYTTSVAYYNSNENTVIQEKMLLPVKQGELGLRQSDAVFHHTRQLPQIIQKLFSNIKNPQIDGIGVSMRPRNIEGSYMPCFTCGSGLANSLSAILKLPVYETSHQTGHILAGLFSANRLNLINQEFIAFHISGGTTDCLLCQPDELQLLKITELGTSLDLKAGQAIDRIGVMLGLKFPCGKELEKLALQSTKEFKIKPTLKGMNCCLSGIENKCRKMLEDGEKPCDIAKYCLMSVYVAVRGMTLRALEEYENLPLIYAGGVMSDVLIKERIIAEFDANFAEPQFSCDNAVGTAIFAYLKNKGK